MICVSISGGLGNQLFQYAAGRALAQLHGVELVLDSTTLLRRSSGDTPRQLELHHFRHAARVGSPSETRRLPLLRRLPAVSRWLGPWRTYVEQGLMFNPAFESLQDQTYLVGYWQSHRYFDKIAATLCQELQPAQPLSTQSLDIALHIDSCPSVAVHVRRGDYVTLQAAAAVHGALPIDYYSSSIARVRASVAAPHFFVFSDDPQWCRSNLPLGHGEATYVSHNSEPHAWQDLMLMSRCRHHVIANSSFSWWGAWLADQRWADAQRQLLAPARWFLGLDHDTRDRYPPHWKAQS